MDLTLNLNRNHPTKTPLSWDRSRRPGSRYVIQIDYKPSHVDLKATNVQIDLLICKHIGPHACGHLLHVQCSLMYNMYDDIICTCHDSCTADTKEICYVHACHNSKTNIFSSIIREDKWPHGSQKVAHLADIKWEWPLRLWKKNVGVSEMLDGKPKACLFGEMSISESRLDCARLRYKWTTMIEP
jgi:hypothetical protein